VKGGYARGEWEGGRKKKLESLQSVGKRRRRRRRLRRTALAWRTCLMHSLALATRLSPG